MSVHVVEAVSESTARRVHEEFAVICGHLNVLHARMVELVAEVLAVDAWGGPGLRSPAHWLAWQTGLSPARAERVVEMARRRDELPVTFSAFAEGELSIDQVAAVVAHAHAHHDAEVCQLVKNATVSQISSLLSRFRFAKTQSDGTPSHIAAADDAAECGSAADDATDVGSAADASDAAPAAADANTGDTVAGHAADDPRADATARPSWQEERTAARAARKAAAREEAERARIAAATAPGRLSHGYNDHGRFYLHLELPADEGAVIDQALQEAHSRRFHAGQKDVSWADAMVDVAHRSLAAIDNPDRRDQYRTYIHLDTEGTWLDGGPGLPQAVFEKWTCDGIVRPLWETEGAAINVGRQQHAVPPHTRRVVLDRDRTCRYPGCPNTRHLEVHHVLHWARDRGPTDTWNLAAHCPFHHDAIHRSRCTVEGNADLPDGLVHRHADGRVIIGHHAPAPPGTAPPPGPSAGHEYRHPLGEPIHWDTVWLSSPPDPAPPEPARGNATPPDSASCNATPPGADLIDDSAAA